MINWAEIKDGYVGFERLATAYVAEEFDFPYGNWKQTKPTRDGNKDAYTIIIGFHPYIDQDVTWWMEAKYSSAENVSHLTRFRLDATIVSSIFHKQVSKIIFVTNIDVHSKTVSDIRFALQKAIGCKEVHFCTRKALEYWLLQNPQIYRNYFDAPITADESSFSLFVSEDASLYPYPHDRQFSEKCSHIYIGQDYQAFFKVISPKTQTVQIAPAQSGIRLESSRINLIKGENILSLKISFLENYMPITVSEDGCESHRLEILTLEDSVHLILKNPISLHHMDSCYLRIKSHSESLSSLLLAIQDFQERQTFSVSSLHGDSGTGKTHIVRELMAMKVLHSESTFYHNFSEDQHENSQTIVYLILFFLFPYLRPQDIDPEYLKELDIGTRIPEQIFQLVEDIKNPSGLTLQVERHCQMKLHALPHKCSINSRYIFLDNIHKLNETNAQFLLAILQEVHSKLCPVFLLVIGQTYMLESTFYRTIMQKIGIKAYECELDEEDIMTNLSDISTFNIRLPLQVMNDFFPNLVIFTEFLKLVRLQRPNGINDVDELLTIYMMFSNGNMAESLVIDQFNNAYANEATKKLCMSVYTSSIGVPIGKGNDAVNALLNTGLVKVDAQNRLIPFHDIYVDIYRRANRYSKKDMGISYIDEFDEVRDKFQFSTSYTELAVEAERIAILCREGKFHSVCYILEPVFSQSYPTSGSNLRRSADYSEIYYRLYFDYAYSTVNSSSRYTGYDFFEKIYNEIKYKTSDKMRLLKLEVLYELMNSSYNILDFSQAMKRYMEFINTMSLLIRSGIISAEKIKYDMYIHSENMRILTQSAKGKKKSEAMFLKWRDALLAEGYDHIYVDFNLRYAHTIYITDIKRAFQYTKEALEALPEQCEKGSKLWCFATFQYHYLQYIQKRDKNDVKVIEQVVDAARSNCYSSFRHRNLAFCSILYQLGDVEKADSRFFQDMSHPRQLRAKLKGFYYEVLAIHHLLHEEVSEAIDALHKAQNAFQKVPSYLRTILHNQKVLERKCFSPMRMEFWVGGPLKSNWYYIDPRVD